MVYSKRLAIIYNSLYSIEDLITPETYYNTISKVDFPPTMYGIPTIHTKPIATSDPSTSGRFSPSYSPDLVCKVSQSLELVLNPPEITQAAPEGLQFPLAQQYTLVNTMAYTAGK